MKKFAVIGNPVEHSLSPRIHGEFARQFGLQLDYTKIFAQTGEFESVVKQFQEHDGAGLNVTIPYKSIAYEMSHRVSAQAKRAQAVNTLSFRHGIIHGDNTDGTGLVNDLINNLKFDLCGKSILILGAGGAVSGVLGPLMSQHPERIVVANRTPDKALELAGKFSQMGPVVGCGLEQINAVKFDLIINGTAASLAGQMPSISEDLLSGTQLAYDMMYAAVPTVFMRWAAKNGVSHTADGLGMLVEQAAAAFYLWHNVVPDTISVLAKLRPKIK